MIVRLNHEELDLCMRVSLDLCAMHIDTQNPNRLAETFNGIKAEFAVIKYLNWNLGAEPPVAFRIAYNDRGGDGGFDFELAGLKFDVKHNNGELLPKQIFVTGADILARASKPHYGKGVFINGWAPAKVAQEMTRRGRPVRWQSMRVINQLCPERFTGTRVQPKPMRALPERCDRILGRVVHGWNLDEERMR